MTSPIAGQAQDPGLSLQQQRQRAAFWFLAPMLIALFCVAAWPLLRTIWFSLTDTSLNNLYGGKWIGFDNYLRVQTLSNRHRALSRHAGRSGLVERGLEHRALLRRLGHLRDHPRA